MNLGLARHIEELGPGSAEADQLMRGHRPDDRFRSGRSPEEELASLVTTISTFAGNGEQVNGGESMLYTRTIDFAETSLHVVLTAIYRKGRVSGAYIVPKSADATWRSDRFPEDKPLAVESVYKHFKMGGGSTLGKRGFFSADAPKLRESIAAARSGR